MGKKLVYIIVLNWNNFQDTIECVSSCQKLIYPDFRLLIVDNGSTDQSEEMLRKEFPRVEFIQTGENLGFAGGNNVGIRYALEQGADYIWLLNNDTTVDSSALTELVKVIDNDSNIAMVGSKILLHDQPNRIWFAGGTVNWENGTTNHIGFGEFDDGQYNETKSVEFLTGCSLLVTRKFIDTVGFMREEYFLYYEETDWCARALKARFNLIYAPRSIVYHKVSASTGKNSPLFYYYITRNRFLFLRKLQGKISRTIILRNLIMSAKYIVLHENQKLEKLSAVWKGFQAFTKDLTGKGSW